jgi:hypothetical protein
MPDGKAFATYLLSAAALLGPLAFILFAFHEMGRLNYFEAPTEFMQLSSFGILPVITTVYPAMFTTFLVVGLLSGVPIASANQKIILIVAACTYGAMVLFYLSLTPTWQWVSGVAIGLGFIAMVLIPRHTPDVGNEKPVLPEDPQHPEIKHYSLLKKCVITLASVGFVLPMYSALGIKDAVTQEHYWVVGNEVVIGFYGDLALIGERSGYEVGPKFRFVELKSSKLSMSYQRIGPLKPAPVWKKEGR